MYCLSEIKRIELLDNYEIDSSSLKKIELLVNSTDMVFHEDDYEDIIEYAVCDYSSFAIRSKIVKERKHIDWSLIVTNAFKEKYYDSIDYKKLIKMKEFC